MAYHSALKEELEIEKELNYYVNNGNVVFAWDVMQGVHDMFYLADAIYTEPSWRDGYDKFMQRAGQPVGGFQKHLEAIVAIIEELAVPSYVVMGKHMVKALQPPLVETVRIHGYDGLVGIWNAEQITNVRGIEDLMRFACERHKTVLDFCCGYGNIARYAQQFICSDINRKCVYHVAKTYMEYE